MERHSEQRAAAPAMRKIKFFIGRPSDKLFWDIMALDRKQCKLVTRLLGGPGSSVTIVSGYGQSRFDPQHRQKDFSSSLCAQTSSGAHPASCTINTGGPFPGSKACPGCDSLTLI
jgi:hypothetical protein